MAALQLLQFLPASSACVAGSQRVSLAMVPEACKESQLVRTPACVLQELDHAMVCVLLFGA